MMEASKWLWFHAIIIVFLSSFLDCGCEGCLEQERTALQQLKPFFNRPDVLRSWVDVKPDGAVTELDCCKWERVDCNITSRRVIQLCLNDMRLQRDDGYLNVSLFLPFEELKSLYLNGNGIAGFVGGKGSGNQFPVNLEILDLSFNGLKNDALTYLSGLLNLKSLNINDNHLDIKGRGNQFPINLEILDLRSNWLKNDILTCLNGLSSLKSLNIGSNELQGSIDIKELNGLKTLKKLDMSDNRIECLQSFQDGERKLKLMNLEELDLTLNKFNNSIFEPLSELSNLKSLLIGYNRLEGAFNIKALDGMKNLEELDMRNNELQEIIIPKDGERKLKLMNLEKLDLSGNLFNNSIFEPLSEFSTLKSLLISRNGLKGAINIKELDGMQNLEELDMSYNDELQEIINPKGNRGLRNLKVVNLEGVFTNETMSLIQLLKVFSSVKSLILRENYFKETMATEELPLWSKVEELMLENSHINNKNILQIIGAHTLPSLKNLSLPNCGLTGSLPNQGWCDLRHLELLDLGENAFEGILPPCLGNLSSLQYLDISYNQFTGNSSSASLTNLTSLRFIDLSNNYFQVPSIFKSFANHSHLKVLLSNQNQLVNVPQTWTPQFQLKAFSMSNCTLTDYWEQLPEFLYYQYNLSVIDLSYNKIGGRFPTWLFENNTMLEEVFLMGNALDGPLNLPSHPNFGLFMLDISNNNIHGSIPSNICSIFPHLFELRLSRNALKGVIPPCLAGLDTLDLSHNGLSGEIPDEFGKSDFLSILRLSDNNLSGKILPTIFSSISTFGTLYLDGNKFDGELPLIDISTASYLNDIDLSNNHLSGKLPSWMWNVSTLSVLALSNNHLEGPIPKEVCNLQLLKFLDLSQNYFSGSLPSCINPLDILHVHLGRNRLSGPLTRAFFISSSLVTLDVTENNLSGEIPSWFDTLSALNVLLLKANNLSGEIPVQLCNMNSLSIIDLSQNKLSGIIPSCLSNLTLDPRVDKSNLDYSYRFLPSFSEEIPYINSDMYGLGGKFGRFTSSSYPDTYVEEQVNFTTKRGSYTYKGNILDYMSGIDLSCNRLSGPIPIELGNLSKIHSLNLSHNGLTGLIPSSFSKLKQIESLDISYNSLYGEIPMQLIELNALAVFNVSYNNLSGSIPSQKAQFGTFDESTYVGNDLLCGPPLRKNCTTDSPPTVRNRFNGEEQDEFMDPYVFYVTFLVSYAAALVGIAIILYINPYWRQAWFNFIQKFIDACNFFVVDNLLKFSIFRRMYTSFCF